MPRSFSLPVMQRWMQAVIMAPGDNLAAIGSEAAARHMPPEEALRAVLPSRTLTGLQRLGIYRGMYEARLREALAVDYPLLERFLGEELFAELAELYIQENPSRSYTLNHLGGRLPEFLADVEGLPDAGFVHDLARYELAVTRAYDADETPAAGAAEIAAVPEDAWEHARLRPIAALELLDLAYPVNEWADQVRDNPETPAPEPRPVWLAVYRRDYAPRALVLTEPAYNLLRELTAGATLGEAIESAGAEANDLYQWFRDWVSHGLFQAVDAGRSENAPAASR